MKTNHRWLKASIKFAASSTLDMPWAIRSNRRDWRRKCARRAASKA